YFTGSLYGDVVGTQTATRVAFICGVPACDVVNAYSRVLSATACNTPLTFVERNANGSFAATTITLTGSSLINYSELSCYDIGDSFIVAPINRNTIVGINAHGGNPYTATDTTAYGFNALSKNMQSFNTAIGSFALFNNTGGSLNTAVGAGSLARNVDGVSNTAVGAFSLFNTSDGINNTALGQQCLSTNTTGSGNTAIGYRADVNFETAINRTAVGAYSDAIVDNGVVLGNSQIRYIYPGDNKVADLGYPNSNIFNQVHAVAYHSYDNANNYAALTSPNAYTYSYTLQLPVDQGLFNNVLTTDGNSPAQLSWQPLTAIVTSTIQLYGDVVGTPAATRVAFVCGIPACGLAQTYSTVLTATSNDIPNTLVLRNNSGNFIATTVTLTGRLQLQGGNSNSVALQAGPLTNSYTLQLPQDQGSNLQVLTTDGNNPAQLSWQPLTAIVTSTLQLFGDVVGSITANRVATVCGIPACGLAQTYSAVLTATSSDTPNTLVARDNNGNFVATTVTLTGGLQLQGLTSNSVTLKAGSPLNQYTLLLPTTQGVDGQILLTDGQNPAQLSWQFITEVITSTIALFGDVRGPADQNTVAFVCGVSACNLVNTYSKVLDATSSSIANRLVLRDNNASFSTSSITLNNTSPVKFFDGAITFPLMTVTNSGNTLNVGTDPSLASVLYGPQNGFTEVQGSRFRVTSPIIELGLFDFSSGQSVTSPAIAVSSSFGAATSNPVYCDYNTGYLYRFTSAKAYKNAIEDLTVDTKKFHQLRPVSFVRKNDPEKNRECGFIADEINDLFPEIVNIKDGQVESYNTIALEAMHIHEFQKDHKVLYAALDKISLLESKIAQLEAKIHAQEHQN
ncbi:MAG: tail fiber domain-containing protein, partial [Candidatus Babeliaceae bacterium]|nr:tail fiber domain-containing protein [Candidatus Babeliaceae bacterium]